MIEKLKDIDPREIADPDNRNGHAPFPKTIVVSSERSGLNLVRHIVESLTPYRTPGKPHIRKVGRLIFHRTHYAYNKNTTPGRTSIYNVDEKSKYKNILLLLRDPRESFVRAYKKDFMKFKAYCENITAYNNFNGEKKIIYYDDLISDDTSLKEIFSFLDIEKLYISDKIPNLRSESVRWYDNYQQKGGGSVTKGSTEMLTHHQQDLTQNEVGFLSQFLKDNLGDNVKYLAPWNNDSWI